MNTSILINIEHPDDVSAESFIEHAIKPVLNDIDADAGEGWAVTIATVTDRRDRALRTVISLVLSDFPEDWTTDEILEGIEEFNDLIVVWEPFENWESASVVNYIDETAEAIYNTYF